MPWQDKAVDFLTSIVLAVAAVAGLSAEQPDQQAAEAAALPHAPPVQQQVYAVLPGSQR